MLNLRQPFKPVVMILPTRDLMHDFVMLENMFRFYPDGVRGVVRDSFSISTDFSGVKTSALVYREEGRIEGLMGSVLDSYEAYIAMHDSDPSIQVGLFEDLDTIELMVDLIEQRTDEFLRERFRKEMIQIVRPIQWLDLDLVVQIRRI